MRLRPLAPRFGLFIGIVYVRPQYFARVLGALLEFAVDVVEAGVAVYAPVAFCYLIDVAEVVLKVRFLQKFVDALQLHLGRAHELVVIHEEHAVEVALRHRVFHRVVCLAQRTAGARKIRGARLYRRAGADGIVGAGELERVFAAQRLKGSEYFGDRPDGDDHFHRPLQELFEPREMHDPHAVFVDGDGTVRFVVVLENGAQDAAARLGIRKLAVKIPFRPVCEHARENAAGAGKRWGENAGVLREEIHERGRAAARQTRDKMNGRRARVLLRARFRLRLRGGIHAGDIQRRLPRRGGAGGGGRHGGRLRGRHGRTCRGRRGILYGLFQRIFHAAQCIIPLPEALLTEKPRRFVPNSPVAGQRPQVVREYRQNNPRFFAQRRGGVFPRTQLELQVGYRLRQVADVVVALE